MLLQNGADPNMRNTDGNTPIDVALGDASLVLSGQYRKVSPIAVLEIINPLRFSLHFTECEMKHAF